MPRISFVRPDQHAGGSRWRRTRRTPKARRASSPTWLRRQMTSARPGSSGAQRMIDPQGDGARRPARHRNRAQGNDPTQGAWSLRTRSGASRRPRCGSGGGIQEAERGLHGRDGRLAEPCQARRVGDAPSAERRPKGVYPRMDRGSCKLAGTSWWSTGCGRTPSSPRRPDFVAMLTLYPGAGTVVVIRPRWGPVSEQDRGTGARGRVVEVLPALPRSAGGVGVTPRSLPSAGRDEAAGAPEARVRGDVRNHRDRRRATRAAARPV